MEKKIKAGETVTAPNGATATVVKVERKATRDADRVTVVVDGIRERLTFRADELAQHTPETKGPRWP